MTVFVNVYVQHSSMRLKKTVGKLQFMCTIRQTQSATYAELKKKHKNDEENRANESKTP